VLSTLASVLSTLASGDDRGPGGVSRECPGMTARVGSRGSRPRATSLLTETQDRVKCWRPLGGGL
jgi:hypothetical protein